MFFAFVGTTHHKHVYQLLIILFRWIKNAIQTTTAEQTSYPLSQIGLASCHHTFFHFQNNSIVTSEYTKIKMFFY